MKSQIIFVTCFFQNMFSGSKNDTKLLTKKLNASVKMLRKRTLSLKLNFMQKKKLYWVTWETKVMHVDILKFTMQWWKFLIKARG